MIHFAIGAAVPVMSRRPGVSLTDSNNAAHRVIVVVTVMRRDERVINPFWMGALSGNESKQRLSAPDRHPGLLSFSRPVQRVSRGWSLRILYLHQDAFNHIKRLS
jgi:hypothetical protein